MCFDQHLKIAQAELAPSNISSRERKSVLSGSASLCQVHCFVLLLLFPGADSDNAAQQARRVSS